MAQIEYQGNKHIIQTSSKAIMDKLKKVPMDSLGHFTHITGTIKEIKSKSGPYNYWDIQ